MANQVPSPAEPRTIEHYVGAAIVTAFEGVQMMAPVIEGLSPEDQNAFIMDTIRRTADIAGETIRAHHADGKVDI
ncbi:hypothetical protein SEA_TUKTUK_62 [Microbacterium phage TukTuk]